MFPKLDFRVHTTENDVASIVLTGTQAVEFIVVKAAEPFSALRVRPDPILKALLDQLLLCLCDCRFLLVQNGFLFAVCVLYIVEDADIFKVQCFLDYLVGVDAPRTVGTVCLHIAAVIGLTLNIPLAGIGREMNLDVPLCVPRCSQELKHKLFDNFGRQPSSTKPNGDLAGGQVFRLYPFQCFHIYGVIFRVKLRRLSGEYQLFPDIAGEVFVCHQVLCLRGIAVPVHRVQKDNALQVCKDFFLGLAGQLAHIIHIHTGFFAHRNGKRFAGGIYGSDRGVWLDGSLVEYIRLAFKLPFIAQDLKSREQRKGAVLRKCGDVGTAVDKSVLLGKGIIKSV